MKAQELLNTNNILNQGENTFALWPPNEYHNHVTLTLKSKFGFRRFEILDVNKEISELQQKAIEIDSELCCNPVKDEYKKYIGLNFIPI